MFEETGWALSSNYFYIKDDVRAYAGDIMPGVSVWCTEQFGPEGPVWSVCSDYEIRFANPDHAFAFKIRWG